METSTVRKVRVVRCDSMEMAELLGSDLQNLGRICAICPYSDHFLLHVW